MAPVQGAGLVLLVLVKAQTAPQLDQARSQISFHATSRLADADGSFTHWQLAPTDWEPGRATDPTAPAPFTVTIDLASVKTGSALRDRHLREQAGFFEVADYPLAQFTSSGIKVTGSGRAELAGTLTMHDHSQRLQFDVVCTPQNRGTICRGEVPLNRFALGIDAQSWWNPIGAAVQVHLQLFFADSAT